MDVEIGGAVQSCYKSLPDMLDKGLELGGATACVFADIDLDSPHVRTFKMLYAPGGLIRAKSHCHL